MLSSVRALFGHWLKRLQPLLIHTHSHGSDEVMCGVCLSLRSALESASCYCGVCAESGLCYEAVETSPGPLHSFLLASALTSVTPSVSVKHKTAEIWGLLKYNDAIQARISRVTWL